MERYRQIRVDDEDDGPCRALDAHPYRGALAAPGTLEHPNRDARFQRRATAGDLETQLAARLVVAVVDDEDLDLDGRESV
jgi:hypothetical protein